MTDKTVWTVWAMDRHSKPIDVAVYVRAWDVAGACSAAKTWRKTLGFRTRRCHYFAAPYVPQREDQGWFAQTPPRQGGGRSQGENDRSHVENQSGGG